MDLDALSAARQEEWARLDELSRSRRLTGTEVDELVTRYRAASADLADIKTSAGRTAHGDHVSTMLARGGSITRQQRRQPGADEIDGLC